jgi:hypothetical protein
MDHQTNFEVLLRRCVSTANCALIEEADNKLDKKIES